MKFNFGSLSFSTMLLSSSLLLLLFSLEHETGHTQSSFPYRLVSLAMLSINGVGKKKINRLTRDCARQQALAAWEGPYLPPPAKQYSLLRGSFHAEADSPSVHSLVVFFSVLHLECPNFVFLLNSPTFVTPMLKVDK
jgi:hypothetical protein